MRRTTTYPPIILEAEQKEVDTTCKKFGAYNLYNLGEVYSIPHDFVEKPASRLQNDPSFNPYKQDIEVLVMILRPIITNLNLPRPKQGYEHYLSPLWLIGQSPILFTTANVFSQAYVTMENFKRTIESADIKDIADELGSLYGMNISANTIQMVLAEVDLVLQKSGDRK